MISARVLELFLIASNNSLFSIFFFSSYKESNSSETLSHRSFYFTLIMPTFVSSYPSLNFSTCINTAYRFPFLCWITAFPSEISPRYSDIVPSCFFTYSQISSHFKHPTPLFFSFINLTIILFVLLTQLLHEYRLHKSIFTIMRYTFDSYLWWYLKIYNMQQKKIIVF